MRAYPVFFGTLILLPCLLQAQEIIRVPADTPNLGTAMALVPEGGVVEIAAGTYASPAGGWVVSDLSKNFTVRAATGAQVTLDGGSSRPILKILNSSSSNPNSVVFQGVDFVNGFSNVDGTAGGVTLNRAKATFIDCEFRGNEASPANTGGGGIAVFLGSQASFFDCLWDDNRARNEGGGLKVGGGSRATIHDSEFRGNRTNVVDHRPSAAGAGIHMANSILHVANTRFEANEGACIGGAIYALADFDEPQADLTIVNSTFVDNFMAPQPGGCSGTLDGAGMHVENNVHARVYNSRFLTNLSQNGGAISMFRSTVSLFDSVFRGNEATEFGGALSSSSLDLAADGNQNHPSSQVTIRDSLFQGRFGGAGSTALRGGCLWMLGDTNRTYGRNGVIQMGTPEINRAGLDVTGTVFADCDAESNGNPNTGVGGAMQLSHVALDVTDSLFIDNDAIGALRGRGGAIRAMNESAIAISSTTFANNTAAEEAGALWLAGSTIDVDGCFFFDNQALGSGNVGSAISTLVLENAIADFDFDVTGQVRNSIFSRNNPGIPLRDWDSSCAAGAQPINGVVYDNNQFFTEPQNSAVFFNNVSTPPSHTVSGLNALVVNRSGGCPSTNKSIVDNDALGSAPELGALLGVPPKILPVTASGDPQASTRSFLAWAGDGGSLTLDGAPLATSTGVQIGDAGSHTLVVGSSSFVAQLTDSPAPSAAFSANPPVIAEGETSDLAWSTTSGSFLDVTLDRGVPVPRVASGSVTVAPAATKTYRLCLLTEEGGVDRSATVAIGDPSGLIFMDGFESGDTSAW